MAGSRWVISVLLAHRGNEYVPPLLLQGEKWPPLLMWSTDDNGKKKKRKQRSDKGQTHKNKSRSPSAGQTTKERKQRSDKGQKHKKKAPSPSAGQTTLPFTQQLKWTMSCSCPKTHTGTPTSTGFYQSHHRQRDHWTLKLLHLERMSRDCCIDLDMSGPTILQIERCI